MATKLTKKQQTQLTEKLAGIIQRDNALQLGMSTDTSVNEMNINQISGELNRIHYRAIGKDLPTVITIPVKQLGSGDPSPDNVRPITGYVIDGIGTIYGGELNIETGELTSIYGNVDLGGFVYTLVSNAWRSTTKLPEAHKRTTTDYSVPSAFCSILTVSTWLLLQSESNRISIGPTAYGYKEKIGISGDFAADGGAVKTAVTGQYLCYELETPHVYTLNSAQMLQLIDQL